MTMPPRNTVTIPAPLPSTTPPVLASLVIRQKIVLADLTKIVRTLTEKTRDRKG